MNTTLHAALVLALAAGSARAQRAEVPMRVVPYAAGSGVHSGSGEQHLLAFEHTVTIDDAAWLRLRFSDFELGDESYVTAHSLSGQFWQTFDHETLKTWNAATGLFAGNSLTFQLWVAPDDLGVFVDLKDAVVGEWSGGGSWETLCGTDGRVASTDNRMGRMMQVGCTAWRTTNGALVTAGHCVDNLALVGIVEFNVPPSLTNGTTMPAAPQDQFPIDLNSIVSEFDPASALLGNDWAVFAVGANATTGRLPHEVYGPGVRVSRQTPATGTAIRITGFGTDSFPAGSSGLNNAQSQTNQTSTGDFRGENVASANRATHEYGVDTTGGNSGSAILWNSLDLAIGVHTNGGCAGTTSGSQGNFGTSFEANDLEAALQQFPGSGVVRYVDAGHPRPGGFEDGTIFRPFDRVVDAIGSAVANQIVSIVPGNYAAAAGNEFTTTIPMTLSAPAGLVTIGN